LVRVANNPNKIPLGPTPALGTLSAPVNGMFLGPNVLGQLFDVPPVVQSGLAAAPFVAITGVQTGKLGISGQESPKTHG
jgi:hypothetical protein